MLEDNTGICSAHVWSALLAESSIGRKKEPRASRQHTCIHIVFCSGSKRGMVLLLKLNFGVGVRSGLVGEKWVVTSSGALSLERVILIVSETNWP